VVASAARNTVRREGAANVLFILGFLHCKDKSRRAAGSSSRRL
jgi:hypothetical protein